MRPLARKALEAIWEQGRRVIDHDSIERTLLEINKGWIPGTSGWMKMSRPDEWAGMLSLERRINETALERNLKGLREALNEYERLILVMMGEFEAQKEKKGGKDVELCGA